MDIICDIDGTVADCSHRLHWIQSKPKNWRAFYAGIEHDRPIIETIEVIRCLATAEDDYDVLHRIVFCTGREESYRKTTQDWLIKHLGQWAEDCPLYMRPSGDHRADYVIKALLLATMQVDGYNPVLAFDDRQQVVDMWRQNGIKCFQVDKGDF